MRTKVGACRGAPIHNKVPRALLQRLDTLRLHTAGVQYCCLVTIALCVSTTKRWQVLPAPTKVVCSASHNCEGVGHIENTFEAARATY